MPEAVPVEFYARKNGKGTARVNESFLTMSDYLIDTRCSVGNKKGDR